MKIRWNANAWILTILGGIIVLIAVDMGRSMFAQADRDREVSKEAMKVFTPNFKVGDLAPDFTLPDKDSKQHSLSELAKDDTLLVFSCGCSNCKDFQTYLGKYIIPKMGKHAPYVLSVSSSNPASEAAWIRDTHLKQTILYEGHGQSVVMDQYKGHPCPRAMGLKGGRRVAWIGQSPGELPADTSVETVGTEAAEKLGFSTKVGKSGIKVPVPLREWGGNPEGGSSHSDAPVPPMEPHEGAATKTIDPPGGAPTKH